MKNFVAVEEYGLFGLAVLGVFTRQAVFGKFIHHMLYDVIIHRRWCRVCYLQRTAIPGRTPGHNGNLSRYGPEAALKNIRKNLGKRLIFYHGNPLMIEM